MLSTVDDQAETVKSRVSIAHARWVVMALAFFITIINYMDRSAISYAIGPIKARFHLNDGQFGCIFAAFGLGYVVSTLVGGILVDKHGARRMWSAAAVAWSLMTAALGIAGGFVPLLVLRTMLGITEGPSFPALTRVVTDWLPVSERARATAVGLVAVPLASLIGAPLICNLIARCGWQVMFCILGSVGLVWAVVWSITFRDHPEQCSFVSPKELALIRKDANGLDGAQQAAASHRQLSVLSLLRNPALASNNYAFFSCGYLLFFAIHWLPAYLQSTFKLSIENTGWLLMAPWAVTTVMLATGGWLSDYIYLRTGSLRASRSHIIWICQLLSALSLIPVALTHSLPMAIIFLSLGLGFGLAPNSAFYALNVDLARGSAATALGVMASCSALSAVLAPWLTGILKDLTGDFRSAFFLLIFFSLSAVVVVLAAQHPDRHVGDH